MLFFLMLKTLWAAWPDSFEHRIAALTAFRYDFLSSELPKNPEQRALYYSVACQKGYSLACHWKEWQGTNGGEFDLAVAQLERKCRSKSPLACLVLGWSYLDNKAWGEEQDWGKRIQKAEEYFRFGCEDKAYAPSCAALGDLYWKRSDGGQDLELAMEYFEEACDAKDLLGCWRQGEVFLEQGDWKQAEPILDKVCRAGAQDACLQLGRGLHTSNNSSSTWAQIVAYVDVGCKVGIAEDCLILASYHLEGRGIRRSVPTAQALFRISCLAGFSEGCLGLAKLLDDKDEAKALYQNACNDGIDEGCFGLGQILIQQGDIKGAMPSLTQSCTAGYAQACLTIADVYLKGEIVTKDEQYALSLYKEACDRDMGPACFALADLSAGSMVWENIDSTPLYQKACDLGDGRGCGELANRAIQQGASVWSVLSDLEAACSGKDRRSCRQIATFYSENKNVDAARPFLEQACRMGGGESCFELGDMASELQESSQWYELGCDYEHAPSCDAAEPIAFQARFYEVIEDGLRSNICQVWARSTEQEDQVVPVVEMKGPEIMPFIGPNRGRTMIAYPGDILFSQEERQTEVSVQKDRSFWQRIFAKEDNTEPAIVVSNVVQGRQEWSLAFEEGTSTEALSDDPWGTQTKSQEEDAENPWGNTRAQTQMK
ncbi:MAG: hypothetical protein CMK59_04125, partial [Proteobacteria bacterium]|nr:hypothetical protein [Pseudomonadota bacterium]